MNIATQLKSYNSKQIDANKRKQLALSAITKSQPLTEIAEENNVSRKFIYQQRGKAIEAVNNAFAPVEKTEEKILFYLPVTFSWLCQFILCLVLHCRASHRGIQKTISDMLDYSVSLGSIHTIIDTAKSKAAVINAKQDLSRIKLAAQDEMFHYNKPILTGIDIPSLYCYLLTAEADREFDTWGTHLLDLQKQSFNPERVVGDDASNIRAAHHYVYPKVPYDIDNFHILRDLMEMRRYFRNRLKSSITHRLTMQGKVDKCLLTEKMTSYHQQLESAKVNEKIAKQLSESIDILVNWMQHDVLNKPGVEPQSRYELFDFVWAELNQLAIQHPHRIESVCTTLKNQKYFLLAFSEVLDTKFQSIADDFVYPLDMIWEMCALQRCKHSSDTYAVRSLPLQDYFETDFDAVEHAVLKALDTTERTSSMVENLHGRLRPYFCLRQEIGFGYLDLLRFYLNHVAFQRSEREERIHKSPTEILTGKPHSHWLEMLGFQRFKQAP
jgi:hypothetical protein